MGTETKWSMLTFVAFLIYAAVLTEIMHLFGIGKSLPDKNYGTNTSKGSKTYGSCSRVDMDVMVDDI